MKKALTLASVHLTIKQDSEASWLGSFLMIALSFRNRDDQNAVSEVGLRCKFVCRSWQSKRLLKGAYPI